MRKSLRSCILPLALFLAPFGVMGQTYTNYPSVTVAPLIGITSTNLYNDSISYKPGILFSGGFYTGIRLHEKLDLGIELSYTGKAVKTDDPLTKYRFYYVDLPVYLQYKPIPGFRINFGGQYSKFTNSQITNIDGSTSSGSKTEKYINIKDQDFAFMAGADIDINEKLSVGARYTLSTSTFIDPQLINFGVFSLSFKYVLYRSYRVLFPKKETK